MSDMLEEVSPAGRNRCTQIVIVRAIDHSLKKVR